MKIGIWITIEAAAERVHLVRPEQLHLLPLESLRIGLVLRAQGVDLRLERLHLASSRSCSLRQRIEHNLHEHREQDD